MLLEGLIWVVINGAAIGWAYRRVFLDFGRTGPKWGLVFGALMAVTLVPALVVGLIHGPYPNGPTLDLILPVLPLAFLGVPPSIVAAGGLGAWRRIAWPFVVACLPAGIMIGGSIATFGGTLDLFILFAVVQVFGGWMLAILVTPEQNVTQQSQRQASSQQ